MGSRLTFAPRLPLWVQVPQPLRWCTCRLQSESSFVLICMLVAQSLLQTKLQHPVRQLGLLASPLTQRPYVEPTWKPRSSQWGALEALIYLFFYQMSGGTILGCQIGSSAHAGIEQTSLSPLYLVLNLRTDFCPVWVPFLRSQVPCHPSQSSGCQLAWDSLIMLGPSWDPFL